MMNATHPATPRRYLRKHQWAAAMLIAACSCGSEAQISPSLQDNPQPGEESWATGTAVSPLTTNARILRPNSTSGLCVQPETRTPQNGTAVVLGACDDGGTTNWQWMDGSLRVGDKCIDVTGGNTLDGTRLQLWECDNTNQNQKFQIQGKTITWQNTNKCFDLTGGRRSAKTPIQLWSCDARNNNQQWSIESVAAAGGANPAPAARNGAQTPADDYARAYLKTCGTQFCTPDHRQVVLRGTNIGGWLVTEGWMNGYADASDPQARFSRETLERRFGTQRAQALLNTWYDNFFTSADLDILQGLGVNTIRVPFGWRNMQNADGSWIKNSAGNIDFARLDWIVAESAKRQIYVILDFHIWDTQQRDYSLISTHTDGGHASQARAAALWTQVAKHFKGNATIAAFDVINEPTGSWGNLMQDALYRAVRAQDAQRIIIMESIDADPRPLGWSQVVYSLHQYGMMGNDFATNQKAFQSDLHGAIRRFSSFNIPTYIGEFMAQESGPTLAWLLQQYQDTQLSWTSWTYKTVNMGAWGLRTLPASARVDIANDSYETILHRWQNLGPGTPQGPVVDAFKAALRR